LTFDSLTPEQQIDRLTVAARQSLQRFGLPELSLQPVSTYNNTVFKVNGAGGAAYTLRLHRPGHKRIEWIRSEMIWLLAIRQQTPLRVPYPVTSLQGDLVLDVAVEGHDQLYHAVLFRWFDGEFYTPETIPITAVHAAGTLLANLHQFASAYHPPASFVRPRLDWEGLFGEESPYNPGEGVRIFTDEQKSVFSAVDSRVKSVMEHLGESPDTFGLIHADFLTKNYLFDADGVAVIDFDDCGFGYYLYDLAPGLLQFKFTARYDALREALLTGYSSVRPLSAADINALEAFIAARHLASCRWQAGHLHYPHIRERAAATIAARTEDLKRYLLTGIL